VAAASVGASVGTDAFGTTAPVAARACVLGLGAAAPVATGAGVGLGLGLGGRLGGAPVAADPGLIGRGLGASATLGRAPVGPGAGVGVIGLGGRDGSCPGPSPGACSRSRSGPGVRIRPGAALVWDDAALGVRRDVGLVGPAEL